MCFGTRVLISSVTILIMLFLVVAPSAFATTEEIIETEDDIWDLYYDGEISVEERDNLLDIIQNKVNINSNEVLELDIIPGINFADCMAIYRYLKRAGPFRKVEDLLKVPGIDEEKYRRIKVFVSMPVVIPMVLKGDFRSRVSETADDGKSPEVYERLRLFYGQNLSAYYSAKKGMDEEGYETLWRYVRLRDLGHTEELIAGDYRVSFGQRLVLADRFDGLLWQGSFGMVLPSLIYSDNAKDSQEEIIGANIDLSLLWEAGRVGATWYRCDDREVDQTYYVYGLHFSLPVRETTLFGEMAQVEGAGDGFILGTETRLESLELLALYRSYDSDFNNFHSRGFADSDDTPDDIDEKGYYLEASYKFNPRWKVMAYFDQWKHLSSLVTDQEKLAKLYYTPSKKLTIEVYRKWHDEDIDRDGHSQSSVAGDNIQTAVKVILKPVPKTKVTLFYKFTQKDVSKYADRFQEDQYTWVKIEYKTAKGLELEGRVKYYDTDIHSSDGTRYMEYYLQAAREFSKHSEISIRYTSKDYTNPDAPEPDPAQKIRLQIDLRW